MSERFCSLIFDLDGTLWDCSGACAVAFNRAYESLGLNRRVTTEFVRSMCGKPADECDELLLAEIPAHDRATALARLDHEEVNSIAEHAHEALYPGVAEGLRQLKEHYRIFLVSNCGTRYLDTFLRHSLVGDLFEDVECFGRTKQQKNENIVAVVLRNNLTAPCYIGDTAGDQQAALKAGVPFFHAAYGFGSDVTESESFSTFSNLVARFVSSIG